MLRELKIAFTINRLNGEMYDTIVHFVAPDAKQPEELICEADFNFFYQFTLEELKHTGI